MTTDKVCDLADAIDRFVPDGATICIEGFSHLIPYAAAHEIIRQRKRGLRLVRMTPDLMTDMLLAADCLDFLEASFFASGSAGGLHELRRRVEQHIPRKLEIEEWSHGTMVARYHAGAMGLPFVPLQSLVGSDLPKYNDRIRRVASPYGEGEVYVAPPVRADVTIIHAQRADRAGNVQIWGILGCQQEAAYLGTRTIVTVEEIVDNEIIRNDPNRTVIPAHAVDAVVPVSRGAHPSYAQGYYDRDNLFIREWIPTSKDPRLLQEWLQHWIYDLPDHAAYVAQQGAQVWDRVAIGSRASGTVEYGRRLS